MHAFEPVPSTYQVLQENCAANRLLNVSTYNMAAGAEPGRVLMRMMPEWHSMASMSWYRTRQGVKEFLVDCIDLDSVLSGEKIDFVKIDVEGAEGIVITGMEQLLRSSRPVIFVECTEVGREKVWKTLKAHEYACYRATHRRIGVQHYDEFRHGDFLWLPLSWDAGKATPI